MTTVADSILVLGESLIDRVTTGGMETEHVGGSPANVAIGLARLNYSVTLFTQFGSDRRGREIQRHLQRSIDLDVVQGGSPETPTSTALVTMNERGVPHYTFDLNWEVRFPEIANPSVVHTGSLGAYLEPGYREVARIVEHHAGDATVTFDPNLRPLIMDRSTARSRVDEFTSLADVVKVSDEDLAWLYPGTPSESIIAEWLNSGVKLVALTRGAYGADVWTSCAHTSVPARDVDVADTVGAGDAFMAGLIDALCTLRAVGPSRDTELTDLTTQQLHSVLTHSTVAAAIAVQHSGAHAPTRTELGWCR